MKYLITGGAGFIGSNLAIELVKKGESVRILDNFSTGKFQNLESIQDKIELIDGDIKDFWTVTKAVEGIDYILHQAALPSVPRSIENPLTSNEVNINGTLNLLEAARFAGVKKLVIASSSSVYGDTEELPKHEEMVVSPLSPYAVTKLTCEYYLKVYWELYKFPTVALRYFNIFGPNQDPNSQYSAVFPKFISSMLNGERPVVYGDGEQSRDFTYIDNCVQANILAATNDEIVGTHFNVACGGQFTINQTLEVLRDVLGSDIEAEYIDVRAGDIMHSYGSIDKLRKYGYNPSVSFEEGVKRTVEYFKTS
jgi:UDP-glucose 4-epimerase